MQQYQKLLSHILENGVLSEDRTGEGTRSVFGTQTRYDLSEGFPAVTTKKLAWKAVVSELLWFIEGSTNERRLAEILHNTSDLSKNTIWTKNAENQGVELGYTNRELGPVYGHNWRYVYNDEYFPVKIKTQENIKFELDKTILPIQESNNKHIGKSYANKQGQEYVVVGLETHESSYTIQYTKTGSVYENVMRVGPNISHKDGFEPSLYNVGMLGYYAHTKPSSQAKKLKKMWESILSQCYNPKDKLFAQKKENGISVCDRWLVLSNFIEDAPHLNGWAWFNRRSDIILYKDYYGPNTIYGPDTAVFIPKEHYKKYAKNNTPYMVVNKETTTKYFLSYKECVKSKTIGTIEPYEIPNYVIRHQFPVDQLSELIKNIKTDPYSRRLLLTGLDVGTMNKASLPPCHTIAQFYVRDNKLSCQLYQRSADIFLGVPFNIASYALLTYMIAHVCNMQVGEFVHTIGDAHIYNNHITQVQEQLTRTPLPLPKLLVNQEITSIFDFGINDFILKDYNHHAPIAAVMAV